MRGRYGLARDLVSETFENWWKDNAMRLSAALAFYATFSLAPMLLVVVAASALLVEKGAAQAEVLSWIRSLVGRDGTRLVLTISESAGEEFSRGGVAFTAAATMLLGATAMFAELQDGLNTIWKVKPQTVTAVRAMLYQRSVAFLMVLCIACLLLLSVTFSALLAAARTILGPARVPVPLAVGIDWVLFLVVGATLFAAIYRLLPAAEVTWRDAFAGGIVTSAMFAVGRSLIGLYLGTSSLRSLYGAAGSFAIVLLWLYYCSLIFFFGAEFTRVYGRTRSRAAAALEEAPTSSGRAADSARG